MLEPIPSDHPIYSSFYPITEMRVRKDKDPWKTVPVGAGILETINIGTRAAVIFSPIDLSCGWDADANPIEGGILYNQDDALKLGSNIVTYCLAEYQYARFFDHQKVYHQETDATRDQTRAGTDRAQWRLGSDTARFAEFVEDDGSERRRLHVQFKRVPVDPDKQDILSFPVLYMTGLRDFQFSDAARKRLREYLDHGGALVVDDAIGSSAFDAAFRREIKLIYPDKFAAGASAFASGDEFRRRRQPCNAFTRWASRLAPGGRHATARSNRSGWHASRYLFPAEHERRLGAIAAGV